MTPIRKTADERSNDILECCLGLMSRGLFSLVTRGYIAERLGISPGLITHHFGSMEELVNESIKVGCERRNHIVTLYGLAVGHPAAQALPKAAKKRAALEA